MTKKGSRKKYKSSKNTPGAKNVRSKQVIKNKQEIKKTATPKPDILNKYFDKYGIYILISVLAIISFFVYRDYIFFRQLFIFKDIGSDTANTYYPNFVLLSDYLRDFGIPKWSFKQGMGQNIFPFSLCDPFSYIPYILGKDNLPYSIVFLELIKIGLAGIVFYKYLKILSLNSWICITGAILFAFSGFMILGGSWYVYSTEALYLALLLLSFEKLFRKNSLWLMPLTIALIGAFQPFNLYMYGLFFLIYIIFRYIEEKGFEFKKLIFLMLKILALGIAGVLISAVFMLPELDQMLNSPRVSGDVSYFNKLVSWPVFGFESMHHYGTSVMRLFSSDILGTGSSFKGAHNYLEAPMFYIGLVPLILIPHIFTYLNRKKKILYALLLALFLIPVVFPYFRYAFWLFTGDYYRGFSFMFALIVLIISLHSLSYIEKLQKVNIKILLITLVILFVLLYYPYFPSHVKIIDKDIRLRICVLLVIYSFLIFLFRFDNIRRTAKILLIFIISVEMGLSGYITVNERSMIKLRELKQKTGYNDYTIEALDYIRSIDKGFFRINKDYSSGPAIHTSLSDAKIQDFNGTTSYHSFNQPNFIRFLYETNIISGTDEHETRWASGLSTRPLLQTFGSIKYNLSKSKDPYFRKFGNDSIAQRGDVKIMKNRNFLPMGYTYDSYLEIDDFRKMSLAQKEIIFYRSAVLDTILQPDVKGLIPYSLKDTANKYSWQEHEADISNRKADTLNITEFNENRIAGTIDLQNKKILFLSIPYDKGWKATINGKSAELIRVNIGFTGLILDKGEYEISLNYDPPYLRTGFIISLISVILYGVMIFFSIRKRTAPG